MARIRPERRTPVDLAVTAAIVVVAVVAGVLVWANSPVRQTESVQAAAPVPEVAPSDQVPAAFAPTWRARSSATLTPAVAQSTVVTADGGTVVGRDPGTGREIWRYSRNLDLCGAIAAWPASNNKVLAAYRNSRGCGEITALDASSGQRAGSRSSDADDRIRLLSDSGYVVSQGPTRLETWGSNLVRGIEYGRVDAPVNPDVQPGRTDCRLLSSAVGGSRVAVIERCANDPGYRLTVLGAVLDDDEDVQQYGSSIITDGSSGPPPVLIAMTSSTIAVYDGGSDPPLPSSDTPAPDGNRTPTIRQFSTDGAPTATNTVNGAQSPPGDGVVVTGGGLTSFYTGAATVVLDASDLRPIYQIPGTIGTGEVMAGQLLLPTPGGVSVRDAATGRELRAMALPRDGRRDEPVSLRVLGADVVEQWGSIVQAYSPG
ncbi:PQQ-binding-like beta-propeller repeat protein [Gordonia sp. HNM0687]|uniref:PQQ-binding-like beta-propeller repeat protein n=1 Tax=Gordonia mangrovi TaxID=2665643 RepID=A0A6L7GLD4_9ACTN|nr:PQQ-binding-like beta-propeller repeat protein [Gordonia mangrovi]MXP20686.1 PQQ-binding-like beta-propeller repeat protein [Gordonia mangrovi]UVF78741.1 PQQ-binding-like beta-propeller repeat protein [Gordonia mangrovi]